MALPRIVRFSFSQSALILEQGMLIFDL